jgi:hypothetical protein
VQQLPNTGGSPGESGVSQWWVLIEGAALLAVLASARLLMSRRR